MKNSFLILENHFLMLEMFISNIKNSICLILRNQHIFLILRNEFLI